jgi:hypothetical protein
MTVMIDTNETWLAVGGRGSRNVVSLDAASTRRIERLYIRRSICHSILDVILNNRKDEERDGEDDAATAPFEIVYN